jgi:hypothetical protein
MVHQTTHTPPGEQHDFRVSHDERANEALCFLQAELPDARITMDTDPAIAPTRVIVVEECDHGQERIQSLTEDLKGIVASLRGVEHYPDGANIHISA